MRKLSLNQEIKLLKSLKNAKILDNGSSRIVFVNPENADEVVKVAVGTAALRQNTLEVSNFKNFSDWGILAEITAYGRFCVVMERMRYCYDWEDDEEGVAEIADELEKINGSTSDNYQVGLTKNGEMKAYDYGFETRVSHKGQRGCFFYCGWADAIDGRRQIRRYLNTAISLLREKRPLNQIEKRFGHKGR